MTAAVQLILRLLFFLSLLLFSFFGLLKYLPNCFLDCETSLKKQDMACRVGLLKAKEAAVFLCDMQVSHDERLFVTHFEGHTFHSVNRKNSVLQSSTSMKLWPYLLVFLRLLESWTFLLLSLSNIQKVST